MNETLSRLQFARSLRVCGTTPVVVACIGQSGNLALRAGEVLGRTSAGQTTYKGRVVAISSEQVKALLLKGRVMIAD